jgi:DNA modification methylase
MNERKTAEPMYRSHLPGEDWRIYCGPVGRIPLPDDSVHTCLTSPPYWGLRDYGTGTWEGGDAACDHEKESHAPQLHEDSRGKIGRNNTNWDHRHETSYRDVCGKCGAVRVDEQIGLEATPEIYLAGMVEVFREVKRVLRPDGTLFVNMGDSYAGNGPISQQQTDADIQHATVGNALGKCQRRIGTIPNLPAKNLIGMPWRLALALQADGWILRADLIWHKPNPMPESVTDRPTKSHEYVFLLAKSERYFFDQEAIREEGASRSVTPYLNTKTYRDGQYNRNGLDGSTLGIGKVDSGRNPRSVWTICAEPSPIAHFALMPRELARRCIKAGTSERGACPTCGAPWERVSDREVIRNWKECPKDNARRAQGLQSDKSGLHSQYHKARIVDLGWRPTCICYGHFETIDAEPENLYARPTRVYIPDGPQPEPVPCLVLDPFAGAGTTLVVAVELKCRAVGVELSPEYCRAAEQRLNRPHARVRRAGNGEALPLFPTDHLKG